MAIITDTYLTYGAKGIREELSDVIYNISPEETPFISNIGRGGKIQNTYYEWQTDALASAAANDVVEGNEAAFAAETATKRLANYAQISTKTCLVSGTLDVVNKAGRKSEVAYLMAKKSAELKRDMEYIASRNQAARAGNSSTSRRTAGFEAFIRTNVSYATGGTPSGANPTLSGTTEGYPNAGPTDDGTPRAFSETILKAVMAACYDSGGKPTMLIVDSTNKQLASTFSGIASLRYNAQGDKPTTLIGAVDVYVSDFGNLSIIPSRFSRASSALFVDPEYAEVVFLRPFQWTDLAKTGDAEKKLLLVEWGLKIGHEAAHGIARDLT
jgi:hypothetical protein